MTVYRIVPSKTEQDSKGSRYLVPVGNYISGRWGLTVVSILWWDVQGLKIHLLQIISSVVAILSISHKHLYLGATLENQLSWSTHITNIATCNKATRILNFIKCHLGRCSTYTKATAYLLMIWPVMEYICVVWDPHYQIQTSLFEKVQRRAARWILSDYSYHSSVTNMLNELKWLPLSKRGKH